jgi:uncharacterized membrane protein
MALGNDAGEAAARHGFAAGPAPAATTARPVRRVCWVPWLIAVAAFAAYCVISISWYVRLQPGSDDLATFTEYVKQYANLRAPVVDVRSPGFNLLGDHFHPIVALIAPFFRLFPTPVTLLVAQALLVAVSVIPVDRAATAKLGTTAGHLISGAYAFSWGLQRMIDFDFHELAFAVPLLAFSLSALVRGRFRAATAWALPLVFVKEDQGFTVAAVGVVMLILAWRSRGLTRAASARAGAFLVAWGIAWSVLAIEVIIPFFNPDHTYDYWSEGGIVGASNSNSITALFAQFAHSYPQKLGTLALVLLPVAFVALRSPLALVAVPSLVLRFLNTDSAYWGDHYHYNAPLMPIVFVAAVDALARLHLEHDALAAEPGPRQRLAAATVRCSPALMAVIGAALAFWFPLRQLWQPQTYVVSPHARAANAAMAKVPNGVTVEATVTLAATLSARADTFWAGDPANPPPEYIAIDDAKSAIYNPKPVNVYRWVARDHEGVKYRQIFEDDHVYVFRRV